MRRCVQTMSRSRRQFCHFDVLEAVGMTEDILIETHGNNIGPVCQAHPIASGTVGRMAVADSLWPTSYRRQMIH